MQNEPTTNWPGRTVVTALPTSSTTPQYSWPIAIGEVTSFSPRKGHRSDPQMQVADSRMMASVGLDYLRLGDILATHVTRSIENSSQHDGLSFLVWPASFERSGPLYGVCETVDYFGASSPYQ